MVAVALADEPSFKGEVHPLSSTLIQQMNGTSYHAGCPLPASDLVQVSIRHWGFDDQVHDGTLIVESSQGNPILTVFEALFRLHYPIESVQPVSQFAGIDAASMSANNSSAFNCRKVAGTQRWSEHAYGRAIDLNPVQNPYVRGERVQPSAGRPFIARPDQPGVIQEDSEVIALFGEIGWRWGGRWSRSKDYQHFSLSGR